MKQSQKSKVKSQKYNSKVKSNNKFIKLLFERKINFHQLPGNWSEEEKAGVRREALEKITGVKLEGLGKFAFDAEAAGKRNCENLIGGASIPVGIAGPVFIKGHYAKGEFYLPLATTEGALVASINRGCKTINKAGGAHVAAKDVGITRAPVFKFKVQISRFAAKRAKCKAKLKVQRFLRDNFDKLKEVCERTSKHLKLLGIEPFFEEEAVFLRFSFDTGLAMGMNMATIATAAASNFIEKETDLKLAALSGNVCCDKKASKLNFQKGRGKQVLAKVLLTEKILAEVLKTNAKDFYDVYRLKVELGSKVAGTIGKNCQIANAAAAIFLACGQDIAHVTEAAIGETKCRMVKSGVEVSVWLPDLPVGVVGGGTGLTTQRECLRILECSGDLPTDSLKFAEIAGAGVLAGEISLMAALASNDLAKAHQKLGRGKL